MAPLYRLVVFLCLLSPVFVWADQPVIPVSSGNQTLVLDHDLWFVQDTALNMFRIMQEALHNVEVAV